MVGWAANPVDVLIDICGSNISAGSELLSDWRSYLEQRVGSPDDEDEQ